MTLHGQTFDCAEGLYVLLKPEKKNCAQMEFDSPKVPCHLSHLVENRLEDETSSCVWNISGPQLARPTTLQQRYCYPKGRTDYCDRMGGVLWTACAADKNGKVKENFEYRILHVYFSEKRATNNNVEETKSNPVVKEFHGTLDSLEYENRKAIIPSDTEVSEDDDDDDDDDFIVI